MQSEEHTVPVSCASCGNIFQGKFCNKCGEKVLNDKDKSVLHFFEEFVHVLTHADSKFLKSLKLLLVKPGFLTREYLDGRRKKYASPLTMFLIANLLYLLLPAPDTLNSKYISQAYGQPYSAAIQRQAEQKMDQRGWTEQTLSEHYDAKSTKVSKLSLLLLIFLSSIPVSLLYYNKKHYYFDHLVFATEFINFVIYFILLLIPLVLLAVYKLAVKTGFYVSDEALNSPIALVILFFLLATPLALAGKRVYGQSWPVIILKSLLLTIGVAAAALVYRYLLFQITMFML